jgi:phosphate transport system ATP-binding protein
VTPDTNPSSTVNPPRRQPDSEVALATFPGAALVGLANGDPRAGTAQVSKVDDTTVTVTNLRIVAETADGSWSWPIPDLLAVIHGRTDNWTLLVVPGIADFGVSVPFERAQEFRNLLDNLVAANRVASPPEPVVPPPPPVPLTLIDWDNGLTAPTLENPKVAARIDRTTGKQRRAPRQPRVRSNSTHHASATQLMNSSAPLTGLDARNISAWFGSHYVLDRVSLVMPPGEVTALIGPSGCGKSTFLRILNRMHEMVPSASMAGEVLLDGHDIYDPSRKITDARREVGMVFQKPNPFPAMSIYDNVLASFRLTGVKATTAVKDEVVESCLTKAGLWLEVRDRLRQPGGGLSGGQQQRLCIARALAIRPRVLLMDEPCSALDPTSTRRIEETITEIVSEVTIVIVTHNMQQAARVSQNCAFFLAEQGTPGVIVEHGPTAAMFSAPKDPRTFDYVTGRFG